MPAINFNTLNAIQAGLTEIVRAYQGGTMLWQSSATPVLVAGDGLITVQSLAPITTFSFIPGDQLITVSEV